MADAAAEAAAGGARTSLFPARPAPRCGSCDVRRHCPEGRAAAPEMRAVGVAGTVTRPRSRSLLRGLSGVLVGGLVALALVLLAGWFYADRTAAGPGPPCWSGTASRRWPPWSPRSGWTGGATASGRWPPRLAALVVGGLTLIWLF